MGLKKKEVVKMEDGKIKKINMLYLLGYIFGPVLLCSISVLIGYLFFKDGGTGAVIFFMGPFLIAFLWWTFAGTFLFKRKIREFEADLDSLGVSRNQTFYGRGKLVVIDLETGQMGLVFFWNPFKSYLIPATRVEKAWVDDGKSGAGFMEGSSRVSFLFIVDDIKVRVDTFTSNQRFRMDSDYILKGISKADMMVEVIEMAKTKAQKKDKKK